MKVLEEARTQQDAFTMLKWETAIGTTLMIYWYDDDQQEYSKLCVPVRNLDPDFKNAFIYFCLAHHIFEIFDIFKFDR